jgi:hypothetical protein
VDGLSVGYNTYEIIVERWQNEIVVLFFKKLLSVTIILLGSIFFNCKIRMDEIMGTDFDFFCRRHYFGIHSSIFFAQVCAQAPAGLASSSWPSQNDGWQGIIISTVYRK